MQKGITMNKQEILSRVDHTLLKPTSTWAEIQAICEAALRYKTASVCIPPSFVARSHQAYPTLNICTGIGFPLGYNITSVKVFEVKEAIRQGASEVDMVVNLGDVKEHNYDKVTQEIRALKEAAGDKILKVIVETCYLSQEEKIALCRCVTEAGADYIKTSTGFGTGGATLEDVLLFKEHIGPNVKIKAAGGISTVEDLEHFVEAGCDRLGTSRAVKLLEG